jgi:hypothetical protein
MKPKPFASLNHLTVPVVVDIAISYKIMSYKSLVLGCCAKSDAITYENRTDGKAERQNFVHKYQAYFQAE